MAITHAEARRAIYIDFETLRTSPPEPALLGVLIGSDEQDPEQLLVDERLAPARIANVKRTKVAAPPEAVDALVNLAQADDRRILAWSNFDRDRLVEARPDLRATIEDRYANALKVARPWRLTVHPTFTIEREDEHSPKHTLDKYALLARYPHARALTAATPAKWIRHVRQQLHATRGSYRQTSTQAKRDWHRLLEYNRHDLLALRHIVWQATRELECWRAYERTRFCVDPGPERRVPSRICFMAGSRNPRLDALLARRNAARWAFVTAWNPGSVALSQAENDRRHQQLLAEIERLGFEALPGEGIGPDPGWTPEASLLVLGISRGRAESLGRRFGQLAIVVGRRGQKSHLVSTADTPVRQAPVSERRRLSRARPPRERPSSS